MPVCICVSVCVCVCLFCGKWKWQVISDFYVVCNSVFHWYLIPFNSLSEGQMATKDFPVHSPRVSINPKGCRFIDHKMYARLFIFSHSFRSLFCYFHYIFLWPCCWICCHSSIRCIGFDTCNSKRCKLQVEHVIVAQQWTITTDSTEPYDRLMI